MTALQSIHDYIWLVPSHFRYRNIFLGSHFPRVIGFVNYENFYIHIQLKLYPWLLYWIYGIKNHYNNLPSCIQLSFFIFKYSLSFQYITNNFLFPIFIIQYCILFSFIFIHYYTILIILNKLNFYLMIQILYNDQYLNYRLKIFN